MTLTRTPLPGDEPGRQQWSGFLLFLAAYAACLLVLLPKLSLWLDEILDLSAVRNHDLHGLIAYSATNGGGVPLGYFGQAIAIHLLGYSSFSGRLPAAIFSLAACAGVFILALQLKLRFPLLAGLLFCLLPLQLRYALEARPYSQALALSIWATVVFIELVKAPTLGRGIVYGLLTLAGIYTQPFTVFVSFAHFASICNLKTYRDKPRLVVIAGLAIGVAVLAFAPWYFYANHLWHASIASAHWESGIGARTPLMLLRELVGAGYVGTLAILLAVCIAFRRGLTTFESRVFWVLYIVLPIVLALFADAAFHYFLAIRQMIFVLAPLSLLASVGIERLGHGSQKAAAAFAALLIAVFVFQDIHFFTRPREDWDSASRILQSLTAQGDCVVFAPADSVEIYRFFAPDLGLQSCGDDNSVAVAVSPYDLSAYPVVVKSLSQNGLRKKRELNLNGPKIEVYERENRR